VAGQQRFLLVFGLIMAVQRFCQRLHAFKEASLLQIKLLFVDLACFQPSVELAQGGDASLFLVFKILHGGFFHLTAYGYEAFYGRQQNIV
jgi:hypothetical protein